MNSGQTADRVYDALKAMVRERAFRPGARLDPARIASDLVSSVTPVRDALNRLTGEALVETRSGDGFHLPQIDAPALQDLYDWSIELLTLAIRSWPADRAPRARGSSPSPAAAAEMLFAEIGTLSANAEHARAIAGLGDRMHAARLCEQALFADSADEVIAIAAALTADDRPRLRTLLTAYHRRRRRAAADVVRALYRAPTNAG